MALTVMPSVGDLQRHRLGQPGDAVLGGDVGRLERRGDQRVGARRVDDAAPALARFIFGSAARIAWKADDRLMAMIAFHLSMGNSSTGATCWMPALLQRMSTAPNSFSAVGDHVGDLGGLLHVGRRIAHLDAVGRLDPLRGSSRSPCRRRSRSGRCWRLRWARAAARPRPMPEVDPVTSAVLPFSMS